MPNQVTVTGKTMGAQQLTAKVIPNVTQVVFDINSNVFRAYTQNGTLAVDIGLDSVTTVTCTVASGTFAFTLS